MARAPFRMSLAAGERVKGGPRGLTGAFWDGPVEIEYDLDVDRAKKAIKKAITDTCARVSNRGGLKSSIRAAKVYAGGSGVPYLNIWSGKVYSEIQDKGGTIPPFALPAGRQKKRGGKQRYRRVMRAIIGGEAVYFTKRGAITLKAKNYVEKGVDKWSADRGGIQVNWKGVGGRRLPGGDR